MDDSDSAGITAGDVFRSGPASKEMRRHRRVAVFKQVRVVVNFVVNWLQRGFIFVFLDQR